LRGGENNFPSTPFKIYADFNKKYVLYKPMKSQRVISAKTGCEHFAKDYL